MLNHLKEKKDVGFFTSIAGLMNSCTVLDLDAFERNTKAEGKFLLSKHMYCCHPFSVMITYILPRFNTNYRHIFCILFLYFHYWFGLRKLSRFYCSYDTLPTNQIQHTIPLNPFTTIQRVYSECGFRSWRRLWGCSWWKEYARCGFYVRSIPFHSADLWGSQLG